MGGIDILDLKYNNKHIRNTLISDNVGVPKAVFKWRQSFPYFNGIMSFNKLLYIEEKMVFFVDSNTSYLWITVTFICLMGKIYIHKSRVISLKPNAKMFCSELNHFANFLNDFGGGNIKRC